MYNSTLSSGSGITKLILNGDSTVFWRAAIQESLADGSGSSGQFFHDGPHSQGRIHTLICTGSTNIEEITTDLDISTFESVDEIVSKEITAIDSENFNKKMLLDIYNEL